ncbi:LysR family transcriptional regulator [Kiloniella sp. b19]|uniref:LysR family transcriptional regulator n=1 Tax=Kiloniella sp. GXU_MW_B19 TaxID=3141326 RepID=UPI0031E48A08
MDDIALFVHIVQQNGLSGAATRLSLPAATVTRRLQRLEEQLGVKLLHRSARQCVLTQEGAVYYENYADLVEQFEAAEERLSRDRESLAGRLKVLAPTNFSHGFLEPMWMGFMRDYPEIQLELVLSNQKESLIGQKADLALRVGPQSDNALYQLKLGEIETVMVASPAYLEEAAGLDSPQDLRQHRIIGTTLRNRWTLYGRQTGAVQELYPRYCCILNDTAFMKYAALDGQGIALLPCTEVRHELDSGRLQRVLPEWNGASRELFAVWPGGRLLSKKAKALKDYMLRFVKRELSG